MGRTSDARERLIQSGMEIIHAGGYAQAGVQEICTRAGVRKGSFYHFFPSKGDLALAVVEQFRAFADTIFDQALAPDLPPLDRLPRLFHLAAAMQVQIKAESGFVKGCPFGNLSLEMSGHDEPLRLSLAQVLAHLTARLEETLREGDIPHADLKAEAVLTLFEGAMLQAKTRNNPEIIHRMGMTARRIATQE